MSSSIDLIEAFIDKHLDSYAREAHRLSDVAYECLKDAILTVDVRSGDPLSEVKLSKALGISRTPVRAAIQKLVDDGLLQVIPGRAVVIASRSVQEMLDALEVRLLLEPEVCRQVARTLSDEQRELLIEYTHKLAAAAESLDRAAWTRIDIRWHELLCNACPNELLGRMVMQAKHHIHKQGISSQISDEWIIAGTQEHRDVVDAILAGDGDKAAELMRKHDQHAIKFSLGARVFEAEHVSAV